MPTLRKRNKIKKKSNKKKMKLGGANPENSLRNVNKVFNILNQRAFFGEFDGLSTSNLGKLARTRSVNRRQARNIITNVVLKDNIQYLMEQAASAESDFYIRIDGEVYEVDARSYVYPDIVSVNLYINKPHNNGNISQYIGSFTRPNNIFTGEQLIPDDDFINFVRDLLENNGEILYLNNAENGKYNTHRR